MTYEIKVALKPGDPWLFQQQSLTPQAYAALNRCCVSSGWSKSYFLIAVRTDTIKETLISLFLPTFIPLILSTDSIAIKILFAPICLGADLVTLMWRVLTLIPRMGYNAMYNVKANHPLHQYLVAHSADPKLTNADSVYTYRLFPDINNEILEIKHTINFLTLSEFARPDYTDSDNVQVVSSSA